MAPIVFARFVVALFAAAVVARSAGATRPQDPPSAPAVGGVESRLGPRSARDARTKRVLRGPLIESDEVLIDRAKGRRVVQPGFDRFASGPFVVYVESDPSWNPKDVADATTAVLVAMDADLRERLTPKGIDAPKAYRPIVVYRCRTDRPKGNPKRNDAVISDRLEGGVSLLGPDGDFVFVDETAAYDERMRVLARTVYDRRLLGSVALQLRGLWPTHWLRTGWVEWYAGVGRTPVGDGWSYDFGRLPAGRAWWRELLTPTTEASDEELSSAERALAAARRLEILKERQNELSRSRRRGEPTPASLLMPLDPDIKPARTDLAWIVSESSQAPAHPAVARDLVDFLLTFDRDESWRFRFVDRGKYADRFERFTAVGMTEALGIDAFKSIFELDDETFDLMDREFQAYLRWIRHKANLRHMRDGRLIPALEFRNKRGKATGNPEDDDLVRVV